MHLRTSQAVIRVLQDVGPFCPVSRAVLVCSFSVPMGMMIPPEKALPPRFVLTNKRRTELRGGSAQGSLGASRASGQGGRSTCHRSPHSKPCVHNMICFLSAQLKWKMRYADISTAFLQGEFLDDTRVVYVKFPKGHPDGITAHLKARLEGLTKGSIRDDVVKLVFFVGGSGCQFQVV